MALKLSSKNLTLIIFGLGLAGAVTAAVLSAGQPSTQPKIADCGQYRTDRVVTINGAVFNTEVASSAAEFEKGLGGRPCILPNQAMLFAFKQPGQYPFWMKGMKFPIDMIWVNSSDQVTAARIDVQPSTYPQQFANAADHPAQYVLEIKANRAKQLKIGLGTPVNF